MEFCQQSSMFEYYKHNICRGCLMTSSDAIQPTDEIVLNSFTEFSNIHVTKESMLPDRLCLACLRSIKHFTRFKTKCEYSNRILYNLLNISLSNNGEFSMDDLLVERSKLFYDSNPLSSSKTVTVEWKSLLTNPNKRNVLTNGINDSCVESSDPLSDQSIIQSDHRQNNVFYTVQTGYENSIFDLNQELVSTDVSGRFLCIESVLNNSPSKLKDKSDQCFEVQIKKEFNSIAEYFECSNDIDSNFKIDNTDRKLLNTKDKMAVKIENNSIAVKETGLNNFDEFNVDVKSEKSCVIICDENSKLSPIKRKAIFKRPVKRKSAVAKSKKPGDNVAKVMRRTPVVVFGKGSANILTLTIEEQMKEMEDARKSKEYIDSPFKCEPCARGYMFKVYWENHQVRHTKLSGDHECQICRQRYKSAESLRLHTVKHERRLECKQCGKVFIGRPAMADHIAKHDGGFSELLPVCETCGKICKNWRHYTRHLKCHDPGNRTKCPQCPRTFMQAATMHDHIARVHEGVKNFECEICHHKFVTRNEVRMHSIKHSNRRDFYCVECDQAFKSKMSLSSHFKNSSKHIDPDSPTFTCSDCPNRYNTAKKLQEHVDSIHLGLKKWACRRCPSKFTSRGILRSHMIVHGVAREKRKDHPCKVCGKVMATGNTLKIHLLTHTQERPHVCQICGDTFRQRSTMTTHTNLVHLKLKKPFPKMRPHYTESTSSNNETDGSKVDQDDREVLS